MIYKKNKNMVSRVIAGETLIVPLTPDPADAKFIYSLNQSAGILWTSLDGKTKSEDIIRKITDQFDISKNIIQKDINDCIKEMLKFGLIAPVNE